MRLCIVLPLVAYAAMPLLAQKVNVEFDESADFTHYKTFHIIDGQLNAKAAALNSDLTKRNIENEIRKRLTEKGLTEVQSNPDLNVRFSLGSARRHEGETYPAGGRARAGNAPRSRAHHPGNAGHQSARYGAQGTCLARHRSGGKERSHGDLETPGRHGQEGHREISAQEVARVKNEVAARPRPRRVNAENEELLLPEHPDVHALRQDLAVHGVHQILPRGAGGQTELRIQSENLESIVMVSMARRRARAEVSGGAGDVVRLLRAVRQFRLVRHARLQARHIARNVEDRPVQHVVGGRTLEH